MWYFERSFIQLFSFVCLPNGEQRNSKIAVIKNDQNTYTYIFLQWSAYDVLKICAICGRNICTVPLY